MDYRDWFFLKILFETKNISKAAQCLYITQPALTNRLQQMEKEFGVEIVKRGRRGILFTPEGEYLAKCADEMLLKLEEIKENVLNMSTGVAGTLKLGVSKSMMKYKLPTLLRLFQEKYPDVKFNIITDWSSDVFNLVYNRSVHISFVRGDYSWPDKKHLLLEENICVVSRTEIDIKDLPSLPRIDYKTDRLLKDIIDNWWAENYSKPPSISVEVDQVDTCKEMIINNFGYAIMTNTFLKGLEDLYTINLADNNGLPLLRRTWMFYHEESLEINVVKAFVEFIKDFDLKKI